jgi:hypothetical protein
MYNFLESCLFYLFFLEDMRIEWNNHSLSFIHCPCAYIEFQDFILLFTFAHSFTYLFSCMCIICYHCPWLIKINNTDVTFSSLHLWVHYPCCCWCDDLCTYHPFNSLWCYQLHVPQSFKVVVQLHHHQRIGKKFSYSQ